MHQPVLLKEVLEQLDPKPGDHVIDGTADGGGHASAIIEKILPDGMFLGVEWDAAMLAQLKKRFALHAKFEKKKFFFFHGNYADLPKIMRKNTFPKANGLLIDLGFSSEQLANSGRGFSFSEACKDEPLLMTYDDTRESVRDILRSIKEEDLANIIFELGGERYSRRIAAAVVERRRKEVILTVGDLTATIYSTLPKNYERGRIDPATRTFQALRIYANGELENLKKLMDALPSILAPGGRAAIISFHSLEDRIVKNAFKDHAKSRTFVLLTKKPVTASREEIRSNPRSRSAKLRAVRLNI